MLQSLGIRFSIDKVDSGDYGCACWKVFWCAVDIHTMASVSLLVLAGICQAGDLPVLGLRHPA